MSATAFKRDIADPKTVEDFVAMVQSLERLRLLIVLTVADIRAVGPGRWNGWKGQLLRDLYTRAEEVMTGGHATAGARARAAEARERLAEALSDWTDDERRTHLERCPDNYWLAVPFEDQCRHAALMRRAVQEDRPLVIDAHSNAFAAVTEVTVHAPDHAGLFAQVAGAMAVGGANIVDAKIFTTADGMAIDTFVIQDAERRPFPEGAQLDKLKVTIVRTLEGTLRPKRALAKRRAFIQRTRVFTVPPQVFIDNEASNTHTVVEVNGRDRPGFLHDVTHALSELGLTINSAHITTFGERAVDVFYVKDVFGLKVTHETKIEKVRSALMAALEPPVDATVAAE
jgi:[protein-PII] uridylyltransferase